MSTTQPTPGATAEACELTKRIKEPIPCGWDVFGSTVRHRQMTDHEIAEEIDRYFAPLLARVAELEQQLREEKLISEGLGGICKDKDNDRIFFRDKCAVQEKQLAAAKGAVRALGEAQELLSRSGGEMLALAMSGSKHPRFDELCMGVFERHNNFKLGHSALAACAAAGLKEESKDE